MTENVNYAAPVVRALVGEAGARVAETLAADGHEVDASNEICSLEGSPPGLSVVFRDAAGEVLGFADFVVHEVV